MNDFALSPPYTGAWYRAQVTAAVGVCCFVCNSHVRHAAFGGMPLVVMYIVCLMARAFFVCFGQSCTAKVSICGLLHSSGQHSFEILR
jgi:hypothetical protein